MRVIAGLYRGRTLVTPKGRTTRPTTDRVRESLMSTISSARGGFEGAIVLDAFAGSGALGVESLSRGARFACLCDRDRAALEALARNTSFVERGRARVQRVDVAKRLPAAGPAPYDLVYLDPPYALRAADVADLLGRLAAAGLVDGGALVVYEHDDSQDPLAEGSFDGLHLSPLTRKTYGDTVVDLFEGNLK